MAERKQTARERIADAIYLLAAGADPAVFADVLRAYLVSQSKDERSVKALLAEIQAQQPALLAAVLKGTAKRAKARKRRKRRAAALAP